VLGELAPGGVYWTCSVRTIEYVRDRSPACCPDRLSGRLLHRPPRRRTKTLLLILLILPFWISYLMRMLAWVNLLAPDGYVNRFLDQARTC
jgi:spermidine/putrescine transport system permease protein